MGTTAVAGVFIAFCIAVVLAVQGERLRRERAGLIIMAIFSLWGLVGPEINTVLTAFYPVYATRIVAGITGILLAIVAWVRIHRLNAWRFGVIFWPTAILALAVGLGVLFIAFDGRSPELNLHVGMVMLLVVCAAQALVVVLRISTHADPA